MQIYLFVLLTKLFYRAPHMQVLFFTWNTHGTSILPKIDSDADLFIISLQECYKMPSKDNILQSIGKESGMFKYIESCSMWGLKTIIVSKKKLSLNFFRIGQGHLGFINKGFITSVINQNLVHINCHLAAHEHNNEKRIAQLDQILSFSLSHLKTIVLAGDLNFRSLKEADTFKRKYPMFLEHEITFEPTYKYKGNVFDIKRTPSYCDRVLYSSIFNTRVSIYKSLHSIVASDHKPVICQIEIDETKKKMKKLPLYIPESTLLFYRIRTHIFMLLVSYAPIILLLFLLKISTCQFLKLIKKIYSLANNKINTIENEV